MTTGAPDYYKTTLLGGLYDDTPVLAYITSDGRFVFRIEDWPDVWGEAAKVGIAELIAALSAAKRYDRRGNIVMIDDFTIGLDRAEQATSGTGAAIEIVSDKFAYGGYAAKLTGGSDGGLSASLTWYCGLSVATRFGLECLVAPQSFPEYLIFEILIQDGQEAHQARLRYDVNSKVWAYWNASAAYVNLPFVYKLRPGYNLFYPVKFVIDVTTKKYVRFVGGPSEQDLSAYSYYSWPSDLDPHVRCTITVISESGQNGILYLDAVIITQNEPE